MTITSDGQQAVAAAATAAAGSRRKDGANDLETIQHQLDLSLGEDSVATGTEDVGGGDADVAAVFEYRDDVTAGIFGDAVTAVDEVVVVAKGASATCWRTAADAVVLDVFTDGNDCGFAHI